MNAGVGEVEWVVQKDRYKYDEMFDKLGPIDGKISGAAAKQESTTSERTFEIPNATFSHGIFFTCYLYLNQG